MISSFLTGAAEAFGGEMWIIGIYAIAVISIAVIGGLILYYLTKPDKNAQLAKAVNSGHVGEHIGGEDEEDDVEMPAMADSLPQPKLRRVPVQIRETQLPRYQLFGTARRGDEQVAIFTTGRRVRSEGKIVEVASLGRYLVEKSGNRMWVVE